ncbi:MAG: heme ABC transporter ATP-binding protein, partial [Deltaproteobacteria bacterium]|nr:heme ABC transporter ATP-binding protein [Deltaproteobacteria bacterium]
MEIGREIFELPTVVDPYVGQCRRGDQLLPGRVGRGQLGLFVPDELGEIFGIAGISGNGQRELAEVLAGLRKAYGGKVMLEGKEITHASTLER